MGYHLSPSTREWQAKARNYVDSVIPFEVYAEGHHGALPDGEAKKAKERAKALGLSRLDVPKQHGGLELPLLDQAVIWEQLGRATNAVAWHFTEAQPWMFEACTPSQIDKWINPLVRGEKYEAFALTEAEAGSDASSIKSTATKQGDQFVLNGEKWFVTFSNIADFFFFEAIMTDDPEGRHGLFIVDKGTAGIEYLEEPEFSHTFPCHHATMRFNNVKIPLDQLVGKPGDALDFTRRWFRRERIMIAARCCGAASRLIEEGMAFAKTRKVGEEVIADFQLIQAMLADSLTELYAARLMTYEAAAASDRGEEASVLHTQASMAKLYATEMAGRVADRVTQIFGGRGYRRDNVAERFTRELRVDRIWEGTSEIQRLIIARSMIKRGVNGILGKIG
ncbi:MAG: acyl-CoA dehydrogenase family protein [Candidatus Pacebacteria bacterium]|nr:acyl-CoA dehydrogenase family protein [Candidatus Paceibacterota bacterium]